MPAEELFFEPTPGFGFYEPWLEHAVAHPAKMNTWLLEFLIKAYTKEGDTVLDPMAGSGSTGVVASPTRAKRHPSRVGKEVLRVDGASQRKRGEN